MGTIIKHERQTNCMYLQMDPVDNPLSTRPVQKGREFCIEPYTNGRFGFIENLRRQFGACSFPTQTRTRSHGPEPVVTLTLIPPMWSESYPPSYHNVSVWSAVFALGEIESAGCSQTTKARPFTKNLFKCSLIQPLTEFWLMMTRHWIQQSQIITWKSSNMGRKVHCTE